MTTRPERKRYAESCKQTEECALCGATLTPAEDDKNLGLVCDTCVENNEWEDDE